MKAHRIIYILFVLFGVVGSSLGIAVAVKALQLPNKNDPRYSRANTDLNKIAIPAAVFGGLMGVLAMVYFYGIEKLNWPQ